MYEESLQHHGILGQKWGIRRFQRNDGSLTPAGRKRYSTDAKDDYKKVGGPGKVKLPNSKSLNRLADETQKDADITRKNGYEAEANSLQKKADDIRSKAKEKEVEEANRRKKIIIAGAAIAGTALAAYGGYKLYQLNTKATEGISKELNKKALANYRASSKLQVEGFNNHDQGFKIARESGADAGNKLMDLGKNYFDQASLHKDLADQYRFKANSKKYSVKEKYNYLKNGKVEDSALAKLTRGQINDAQAKRSGLKAAVEASKNVSKPKPQPTVQKPNLNRDVRKTTSDTLKMSGQTKFNKAAQANDDLVQELLKKNAKNLGL